jgi:hypothetical protein
MASRYGWINNEMGDAVDEVARIFYIDATMTKRWNEHRRANEPRLMTGWCWEAKAPATGGRSGIKTITAARIDAWYILVQHQEPPRLGRVRAKLRVVADNRKVEAAVA